jgi:hypothetical protein
MMGLWGCQQAREKRVPLPARGVRQQEEEEEQQEQEEQQQEELQEEEEKGPTRPRLQIEMAMGRR